MNKPENISMEDLEGLELPEPRFEQRTYRCAVCGSETHKGNIDSVRRYFKAVEDMIPDLYDEIIAVLFVKYQTDEDWDKIEKDQMIWREAIVCSSCYYNKIPQGLRDQIPSYWKYRQHVARKSPMFKISPGSVTHTTLAWLHTAGASVSGNIYRVVLNEIRRRRCDLALGRTTIWESLQMLVAHGLVTKHPSKLGTMYEITPKGDRIMYDLPFRGYHVLWNQGPPQLTYLKARL